MNLKKFLLIQTLIILTIVVGLSIYYFVYSGKTDDSSEKDVYTCPMHPQIVQDHFGTCPICGMDLVLKSKLGEDEDYSEHDLSNLDLNTVKLSPSQVVLANVQTSPVTTKSFYNEKTFNGTVELNQKKFSFISSAAGGKVIKLYITFTGQYVKKGQPVLELYSPELITAQKEYLLALDNYNRILKSGDKFATEQAWSLLQSALNKLQRWELKPHQISELETSRNVRNTLTIYAGYSGVVMNKFVNQGQWIMEGQNIAELADLSTIWIIANIYETDMQYIKTGQTAEISTSAYPNESFTAKINFIEPIFDAQTRTLKVRFDMLNKDGKLKPDMFVKVKILTYVDNTLAVPKNSVLRKGETDIVYVQKEKGVYVPREIKIGYEQDGFYSVKQGLKEGEIVVSSGGFLIDSESQIQAGLNSGNSEHKKNGSKEEEFEIKPEQNIMRDLENKKTNTHNH